MTRGARPCFFSSLRSRRLAAFLSRRLWTKTSSTTPSWSTARQSQCFFPLIIRHTSSRCHLSPGQGSRRRIWLAKSWPNLRAHWRTVSWLTSMPREAVSDRAGGLLHPLHSSGQFSEAQPDQRLRFRLLPRLLERSDNGGRGLRLGVAKVNQGRDRI